jgi:RNA polymerase sigma-70 factor, ECF subfamily
VNSLTLSSGQFEAKVLPHLDAAYNLARWLVRDEHCAQDLVQEAYLKALRYFASFRGGDARPWLLGIVRNTCYTWLADQKRAGKLLEFRDDLDAGDDGQEWVSPQNGPEESLIKKDERTALHNAIEALPIAFREVLILREIEDMSYESIADILQVPMGTVMSRLSRARALLRQTLGGASQRISNGH